MKKFIYIANIRLPTEKAHGIQIMKMCEAFSRQGLDVKLVVPDRKTPILDDPYKYYGVENNFKIKKIDTPDWYTLGKVGFFVSTVLFLLSAVKEISKGDLVYTREQLTGLFIKDFFLEMHSFPKHMNLLHRFLWKRASRIIVKTTYIHDKLVGAGINEDKISVIHNGVDIDAFNISVDKISARKKLGLPTDKKIALYAGSFFTHPWKGLDILLESADLFDPDTLLVVVGGTPDEVGRIERLGKLNVKAFTRVDRWTLPIFLKSADVLVIPNRSDNGVSSFYTSPLKLYEYMAAKVPIIASDIPSIRDAVDDNEVIFCKPDDSNELSRAIKKVFLDYSSAREKADKAFLSAGLNSWDNKVKEILSLEHI